MPLHLIDRATDAEGLVRQLIQGRSTKAARESAIQAIRAANPGLDLDQLTPGTVVVVPAIPDTSGAGNLVDSTAGDLLDAVSTSLDETEAMVDDGLRADRAERAQVSAMFSSAELRRAAAKDKELKQLLGELQQALDDDDRTGGQQTEQVHAARSGWKDELAALRALLQRGH